MSSEYPDDPSLERQTKKEEAYSPEEYPEEELLEEEDLAEEEIIDPSLEDSLNEEMGEEEPGYLRTHTSDNDDSVVLNLKSGLIFLGEQSRFSSDGEEIPTHFNLFDQHVHLRFAMLLQTNQAQEPFAVLGRGRYSKVMLAQILTEENQVLRHLAIKIQADHYDFLDDRPVDRNPAIDRFWEEEYHNLRALQQGQREEHSGKTHQGEVEIVKLIDIFHKGQAKDEEAPPKFFPTTFCSKRQAFFHTPCPHCGELLQTCTDEKLLGGVRSWRDSAVRYLYCANCYRQGREVFLYIKEEDATVENQRNPYYWASFGEEQNLSDAQLFMFNERHQKVNDYGSPEPMREEELGRNVVSEKLLYQGFANLLGHDLSQPFPCSDCPFQEECYGRGEESLVTERLQAFSFYDYYAIPLELLHFSLEDFCMLLGGLKWQEFEDWKRKSYTSSQLEGCNKILDLVAPAFVSQRSLLHQMDRKGKDALEIFSLKLVLFQQICRGVRRIHKVLQRPHLDLKPENIYIKIPPANVDRPILRDFRAKLLDLACTTQRDKQIPAHLNSKIWLKPFNVADAFTSKHLKDGKYGDLTPGLTAKVLEVDKDNQSAHIMVSSSSIDPRSYTEDDLFLLILDRVGVRGEIWCAKDDENSTDNLLCLKTLEVSPSSLEQLEQKKTLGELKPVSARIYQSFGIPEDIHSLGKILLFILVKSDNFPDLLRTFEDYAIRIRELSSEQEQLLLLRQLLHKDQKKLGKHNIFWVADPARSNAIQESVWHDVLILVFRMITHIPGLSICSHHSDYDPAHPEEPIETVIAEIKKLIRKVDLELFDKASVSELVGQYLNQVTVLEQPPEEKGNNGTELVDEIYQILMQNRNKEDDQVIEMMAQRIGWELTQQQIDHIHNNFPVHGEGDKLSLQEWQSRTRKSYQENMLANFHQEDQDTITQTIKLILESLSQLYRTTYHWLEQTHEPLSQNHIATKNTDILEEETSSHQELQALPKDETARDRSHADFQRLFLKTVQSGNFQQLQSTLDTMLQMIQDNCTDYQILRSWLQMLEPEEIKKNSTYPVRWLLEKVYDPIYHAGLEAYRQEQKARLDSRENKQ